MMGPMPDEKAPRAAEETAPDYAPLAYFSNAAEAGMVCELLRNNGIRAELRGANFGALEPLLLPGGYSEIRLLVAVPDFMRARQLYHAFFASGEPAAGEGWPEEETPDE